MRSKTAILGTICVMPALAFAQDSGTMSRATRNERAPELRVVNQIQTSLSGGLAGRARCDDRGNVYLRPAGSEVSAKYHPSSALPVREVNRDGSSGRSFSIADSLAGLRAIDFFVAADGRVYQPARSESQRSVYVVSYFPDGSVKPKVRIQADFFVPYQLVVFPSGEYLLSGLRGDNNRTPFTAVFDAKGKLVREIYEPEDEDARKRAEAGELGFRPQSMESSNDFVAHGDAVLGSDGNAYVLRFGSPALVYVISSHGDLVRKLEISSPESGLMAGAVRSSADSLAISFIRRGANIGAIKVVDYKGNPIATYAPNDQSMYPGLLACYARKQLTFVAMDSGDLRLTIAEPK